MAHCSLLCTRSACGLLFTLTAFGSLRAAHGSRLRLRAQGIQSTTHDSLLPAHGSLLTAYDSAHPLLQLNQSGSHVLLATTRCGRLMIVFLECKDMPLTALVVDNECVMSQIHSTRMVMEEVEPVLDEMVKGICLHCHAPTGGEQSEDGRQGGKRKRAHLEGKKWCKQQCRPEDSSDGVPPSLSEQGRLDAAVEPS
eukprot:27830-Rhodomonas_salina.2